MHKEKIVFVKEDCLSKVNDFLDEGWSVKTIAPVARAGFLGRNDYNEDGMVGAYIVLEKTI